MAIEGAYVAAGIFTSATFWVGHLWDVAATVVLVQASGGEAWIRSGNAWVPFERFEPPSRLPGKTEPDRSPSLRDWRVPLIVGTPEAIVLQRQRVRGPSAMTRLKRRARRWWRDRRPA
jgi:hypothetical protein